MRWRKDGSRMDREQRSLHPETQRDKLAQVMEHQSAIIRLQSSVIDDLFLLLAQHISAEEADRLPCIQKINLAARLRAEIEEREGG